MKDLRVAVVGSGPAGIYAAAALTAHEDAAVDVIDRLPTPFGLVRYGVAPDHEKMKSVAGALRKVLEHDRVRFLGNIELGADDERGVIPNAAGRILRDGAVVPGEYVAGWIKRGPSGVIGTNKHDATETVRCLLEDASTLPRRQVRDAGGIIDLLHQRGVRVVTWEGWEAIEALEIAAGQRRGAKQVKVADRELLLAAALSLAGRGGKD